MKKTPAITYFVIGLGLLVFMLAALMPAKVALAEDEEPTFMILYVNNDSQFDFTLWLYGPASYTITVPPRSTASYVLDRGWYAFTMESCNLTDTGTFDFTKAHQTIHVPVCGATAGYIGKAPLHIDASDYIRPVRIQIRNKTFEDVDVYIRTLTDHHFLSFEPSEIQYVVLSDAQEEYVYSYIACGVLQRGYFHPYTHVPFDLTCGKK